MKLGIRGPRPLLRLRLGGKMRPPILEISSLIVEALVNGVDS